jgi:hypothetical protein
VLGSYQSPFTFPGGTITEVVVDVSGETVHDIEREVSAALARD